MTVTRYSYNGPRKQTCEDVHGPLTPAEVIRGQNQEELGENIIVTGVGEEGKHEDK